jgi:hypothetical protein
MRRKLLLWLGLLLFPLAAAQAEVTITSPLCPPPVTQALSESPIRSLLPAPPAVPLPGLCLGWVGASRRQISGEIALNFAPVKWQPLSLDLFTLDGVTLPALGLNVPAAKVVSALGINLGSSLWSTFLGALGGGPWAAYAHGKFTGGLYYRAEMLAVNF